MNTLTAISSFMSNVQQSLAAMNNVIHELRVKVDALEKRGGGVAVSSLDQSLQQARLDIIEQNLEQFATCRADLATRLAQLEGSVASLQGMDVDGKIKAAIHTMLDGLTAPATAMAETAADILPVTDDIQINQAPASKKSVAKKSKKVTGDEQTSG